MRRLLARYVRDETGASAMEYGVVVSFISVAIIGSLIALGVNLRERAMDVAAAIGLAG